MRSIYINLDAPVEEEAPLKQPHAPPDWRVKRVWRVLSAPVVVLAFLAVCAGCVYAWFANGYGSIVLGGAYILLGTTIVILCCAVIVYQTFFAPQ